jgi:signal transduction histidine kinase
MRERVRQLQGKMNIESSDNGTTISFSFPQPKASSLGDDGSVEQLHSAGSASFT